MTKKMTRGEKADVVYAALAQLPDRMTNAEIFATVMMLLVSYNIQPDGVRMIALMVEKMADTEEYASRLGAAAEERVH